MALYFLKNAWLAPNGQWFEPARVFPVEIPDNLVPFLPKSAELSDGTSRSKPTPALMANIKTVGGPSVNSAQLFAEVSGKVAPAPAEPEPVPAIVLPEVAAAEQFAAAQVEAEAPAEVEVKVAPKGKRK